MADPVYQGRLYGPSGIQIKRYHYYYYNLVTTDFDEKLGIVINGVRYFINMILIGSLPYSGIVWCVYL